MDEIDKAFEEAVHRDEGPRLYSKCLWNWFCLFAILIIMQCSMIISYHLTINAIRKSRQTEVEIGIESLLRDGAYVDGDITVRLHGDTECDPDGLRRAAKRLNEMADKSENGK